MRWRFLVCATLVVASSVLWPVPTSGVGRPGITPVACPQQTWQPTDAAFDALPGAKAYFGQYDGGIYRVEIPDRWNGELMLSAHGFTTNAGPRGSELRVGLPLIREHLIQEGFAWAASSYRCNGYVPGIGLQDTMALTDLFTKFNAGKAPQRVYLTGGSMGGHVTLLGMHEFPTSFAGGLAMCPSGPELFDYFSAVGAAAEVITGVQFDQPSTVADASKKMADILGTPPALTTKGLQLASVEIQLSGGPRPFAMEGLKSRFLQNISGAALAGNTSPSNRAVSTQSVRYSIDDGLGLTADRLNSAARRKSPDMTVRGPMGPFDELVPFDGQIQRPLLTMHGTGDLYVPIHLERALKRTVADAKHDDLLVQRIYRIAGHCGFNATEQARSFDDLVSWVRNGSKPKGDDVMGDLRDAGRTFTSPLRDGDPGALTVTPTMTTRQN
jgi:pimeloyl-ACP methyl ester carboxylesterase